MKTTSRPRVVALLSLALLATPAAAWSPEEAVPDAPLSLMQADGGCSLTIFPDGSGDISHGASPQKVRAPARTFDFASTLRLFRADAAAETAAARPRTGNAGAVFPGSSEVRPIHDAGRVRLLIEQGWKARLPPRAGLHEDESYQWIRRACDLK